MRPSSTLARLVGRCRATTAAMAAALALTAIPAARAQTVDLTLAMIPAPADAYSIITNSVPERIARATNGRVKVTTNDSLVPGPQLAAAVRDGRIPMASTLHTYLAADEPRMGIFNLPGLIEDFTQYTFVCNAFWCGDVAKIWEEKYNSVVLAEGAWCTQQLYSKEPIRKLEDFKNKRLRVHNPQTAELMNALGAKPVPLPLTEIVPALERGVIDGLFTSLCYGHGQEYWRLAKNVQNWALGPINGWAILVNKDEWNRIPPDLREAIRAEMQALQKDAVYGYYNYVRKAMAEMEAQGVKFWVAPREERNRIFDPKYITPVYDSWYKRAKEVGFDGQAYVQRIREVLGKDLER